MMRRGRGRGVGCLARRVVTLVVASGVAAGTMLYLATSGAGLSALTSNGTNTVQSGTVSVTDDDAATVMFDTFGTRNDGYLTAGQTLTSRCIAVNYAGSLGSQSLRVMQKSV